jgi:hypothetical protein
MDTTDRIVKDQEVERTRIIDTVNMNLKLITDRTPAAALNLPNASSDINAAKTAVEANLSRLAQMTNEVDNAIQKVTDVGKQSGNVYLDRKAQIDELTKEKIQNKNLLEIRKEQAESLKQKYSSANHTSYLGLWRPLSDETRFLLLILSIILGLVALVSVFFVFKDNLAFMPSMPKMPTFPAAKPATQSTNFFGGALRRLFPKKD